MTKTGKDEEKIDEQPATAHKICRLNRAIGTKMEQAGAQCAQPAHSQRTARAGQRALLSNAAPKR